MGDGSPSSEQPLETPLTTQQLQTCIDFMAHHEHKRLPEIERPLKSVDLSDLVPAWDVKFVDLDLEALYLVMHAANFLDIRPLLVRELRGLGRRPGSGAVIGATFCTCRACRPAPRVHHSLPPRTHRAPPPHPTGTPRTWPAQRWPASSRAAPRWRSDKSWASRVTM